MANNFFDLVKPNFFYPFANGDKRKNYDLLQLINNKMSLDNLQVEKEEIVEWIKDYVDNCPIELFDEEIEGVENDVSKYAHDKVRYFANCGWLIEDVDGLRVTYQMDENGIKLLSAMENVAKDDTSSMEYSGFVYSIYANLYNFKFDYAVATIEQSFEAGKQLNSMLRGLNVSIKKYLTKLISENQAKPREILETIFFDYQKKVVVRAFNNFRRKDNPSKFKNSIEDMIDKLLENDNLEKMIDNYITVKCDNSNSVENRDVAREFFISKLVFLKDQFDSIDEWMQKLDRNNTKYIATAQSRLNFLLNEETDVEGRIIECLKGIDRIHEDEFYEDTCFDIFVCSNIDENSLYKPVTKKTRVKAEPLIDDYVEDPIEIEKIKQKLFKENEYAVGKIDEYVLGKLNGKNQIHAKDIPISEFKDILILFLIPLYSANSSISYEIKYLDESFKALGYKMSDYIIERKY